MPFYLEYYGFRNGPLIVSHEGTLNTDRYGLDSATCEWKCQMERYDLAPQLNSQHPRWSWLYMEKRHVSIDPGFAVIVGEYCGITGGRTPSVFEATYGGTEEAIQTHQDFSDTIAGTASSPLNGAIFVDIENPDQISTNNDRAVFTEFRSGHALSGTTSFFNPQVILRENWVSTSPVSGINIGKISSPPFGIAIDGNWLFTGATFQQRGRVYFNSREWRSSGRRGWNVLLYG